MLQTMEEQKGVVKDATPHAQTTSYMTLSLLTFDDHVLVYNSLLHNIIMGKYLLALLISCAFIQNYNGNLYSWLTAWKLFCAAQLSLQFHA